MELFLNRWLRDGDVADLFVCHQEGGGGDDGGYSAADAAAVAYAAAVAANPEAGIGYPGHEGGFGGEDGGFGGEGGFGSASGFDAMAYDPTFFGAPDPYGQQSWAPGPMFGAPIGPNPDAFTDVGPLGTAVDTAAGGGRGGIGSDYAVAGGLGGETAAPVNVAGRDSDEAVRGGVGRGIAFAPPDLQVGLPSDIGGAQAGGGPDFSSGSGFDPLAEGRFDPIEGRYEAFEGHRYDPFFGTNPDALADLPRDVSPDWVDEGGWVNPLASFVARGFRDRGVSPELVAQTYSNTGITPERLYEQLEHFGRVPRRQHEGVIDLGGDAGMPPQMRMGGLAEGPWSGKA